MSDPNRPKPVKFVVRRSAPLQSPPRSQAAVYGDEIAERVVKLEAHAIALALRFGLPFAVSLELPEAISLAPGARVEHSMFGMGEVISVEGENEHALVTVRFGGHVGTKRILRPYLRYIPNADAEAELGSEEDAEFSSAESSQSSSDVDSEATAEEGPSAPELVALAAVHFSKALAATLDHKLQERDFVVLERREGAWGLFYLRQGPSWGANTGRGTHVPLRDAPLEIRQRFLSRSEHFFRLYLKHYDKRIKRMKAAIKQADRTLAMLEELELD